MALNENARKWVEALRSGEYVQGTRVLTSVIDGAQRDCCLGVACKVAIDNGVQLEVTKGMHCDLACMRYNDATCGVPEEVRNWLGLTTSLGEGDQRNHTYERFGLYRENDHGKSFAEIADIIESEPEGLFT
jgi:hypothetical protein